MLTHVAGRQRPLTVLPGEPDTTIRCDAGDGPGIAVRHVQVWVVAARRDPVADTDPLTGVRGGGVRVIDVTGGDEPVSDCRVERRDLLVGVCHHHRRGAGRQRFDSVSSERGAALGLRRVHLDLVAGEQCIEHHAGVRRRRASRD